MAETIEVMWTRLRSHLQLRYEALFDEVRQYPTPIAHCDDQLPKLIEQRSHALSQLRRMGEMAFPTEEFMRAYVETSPSADDDVEAEILAQLAGALGATPLSKGADMAAGHAGGFASLVGSKVPRNSPGTPDGVSAPFDKGANTQGQRP